MSKRFEQEGYVTPYQEAPYAHIIRGPDDPKRDFKASKKVYGVAPHLAINKVEVSKLERDIQWILCDNGKRTFNHICVEAWNVTADVAFQTNADRALWALVERGILRHTMQAPILFWFNPDWSP